VVPPPDGRFDLITGLWTNPGGLPADPERAEIEPRGELPVTLIETIPPELADAVDESAT